MGITQKQQKYLTERLVEVRRSKPGLYEEIEFPKPEVIEAAEKEIARLNKIVERHERSRRKAREMRAKAISDAYDKAKRAILFGDVKEALSAIDAFQNRKF
jgi:hypothetical protein